MHTVAPQSRLLALAQKSSKVQRAGNTYRAYTHNLRIMGPKANPKAKPARTWRYDSESEDDARIARLEANNEEVRAIEREHKEIQQKMTAIRRQQQGIRQKQDQAASERDLDELDQMLAAMTTQMEELEKQQARYDVMLEKAIKESDALENEKAAKAAKKSR